MNDKELPPVLCAAVEKFARWYTQQLQTEDKATKITRPLYHYTNEAGLRGIVESQRFWFTSYKHLNDPSEIKHGMCAARRLLKEKGEGADDGFVKRYCGLVSNLCQRGISEDILGFYIASFSPGRDDLAQWRAYADNGRGFALGLAPTLFEAIYKPNPGPTEHVIMPVVYGQDADRRYRAAIDKATTIVRANRNHLSDKKVEDRFLSEMATQLVAGRLIGISLGVKDEAYRHEKEVRLVIPGQRENQKPCVKTRIRGSETVPFMESKVPLRDKDGIFEIVVGPAAAPSAMDVARRLLQSFGIEPGDRIRASKIPYRAL